MSNQPEMISLSWMDVARAVDKHMSEQKAEIKKLRAALDKAADALHDAGCYDAWAEARAAMGEKE